MELHPISYPFPLARMVSDVEYELHGALAAGDVKGIKYWAELLRDMMNDIIERLEKYG